MALDKQFLKYKLEKIKNDRIFKDQDTETKRRIRKENAKLAQEEADAIHSYLTGEDPIDKFDNKSYLENRLPGSLYVTRKGKLNIIPSQDDPFIKRSKLNRLLKKHKTISNVNIDFSKHLKLIRRAFNKLNIIFNPNYVSVDGNLKLSGDLEVEGDLIFKRDKKREFQNINENGYIELPGGMIMQWGSDTRQDDDTYDVLFPIPFPNDCFSVVVNRQQSGANLPMYAINITKTKFSINRDDGIDDEQTINYIAIGH